MDINDPRIQDIISESLNFGDKWDIVDDKLSDLSDEQPSDALRWDVYVAIGGESTGWFQTNETEHKGWTNKATWQISQMFDGYEGPLDADSVKQMVEDYIYERKAWATSDEIKSDLAFIADVNWQEIAEYYGDK